MKPRPAVAWIIVFTAINAAAGCTAQQLAQADDAMKAVKPFLSDEFKEHMAVAAENAAEKIRTAEGIALAAKPFISDETWDLLTKLGLTATTILGWARSRAGFRVIQSIASVMKDGKLDINDPQAAQILSIHQGWLGKRLVDQAQGKKLF